MERRQREKKKTRTMQVFFNVDIIKKKTFAWLSGLLGDIPMCSVMLWFQVWLVANVVCHPSFLSHYQMTLH